MVDTDRRKFLIASVGVGALGLAGAAALTLPELLDEGEKRPMAENRGILVIVTLYGGNDGLSTVIPYTDRAYHDARPDLAYAPNEVIDLDGTVGLNPALTGLAKQWQDKSLAIVRGVGYPNQDRSHFRSMDIWQTASPAEPATSGWIGRWLDATGDDPLRAVNMGVVVPPLAIGEKCVASTLSDAIPLVPPEFGGTLTKLRISDPHDTRAMTGVCASYQANSRTDAAFRPLTSGAHPGGSLDTDVNVLKLQLDLVAKCVKAGVPTQVYTVSLGGFDTHADERGTQQGLLQKVDEALAPFLESMRNNVHGKDLVVMVYSEFGRRVAANASEGTDHGTSGPVLVLGRPVKGGFYGDAPSLTDLADGDLKTTTDFRDVYAELLTKTVGADPGPSVGTNRKPIGFL
jgi:uncharacterized protein (DUF1501 family)